MSYQGRSKLSWSPDKSRSTKLKNAPPRGWCKTPATTPALYNASRAVPSAQPWLRSRRNR